MNAAEVFEKLGTKYGIDAISEAIDTIHTFNSEKKGFILERGMKQVFSFNKEEYSILLNHFLNHMILNVTERCNFRCTYCSYGETYRFTRDHSSRSMPWPIMKDAIDFFIPRTHQFLEAKGHIGIGYFGGEPLLEKEKIFKSIEYIRANYRDISPKIRYNLTTNGSLLSRDTILKLIEYNFDLTISLDGPAEVNDRYRLFKNRSGTFDTVMKNILLIKELNPDYFNKEVSFISITAPEFRIIEVLEFFEKYFPTHHINFSPVSPYDTTFFNNFNMVEQSKKYQSDLRTVLKKYIEKKQANQKSFLNVFFDALLSDFHSRKLFELPDDMYPNGICGPALKRFNVEIDGSLHMCERINPYFSIGNIKTGFDIDKIFNYIDEYIKTTGNCEGCWCARFCKECFVSSIKNDKFDIERKRNSCIIRREGMFEDMKIFVEVSEKYPWVFDKIIYLKPDEDVVKIANQFIEKVRRQERNDKEIDSQ